MLGRSRKKRSIATGSAASKLAALNAPISVAACLRRSGLRAARINWAPCVRARRAVSKPIPELPPITTTVWPNSSVPCWIVDAMPDLLMSFKSDRLRSTFLVRVKNVIFRLHDGVAGDSTIRQAVRIGSKPVRHWFVVEHRISPSAACRKSLAVLFHDESLTKDVRQMMAVNPNLRPSSSVSDYARKVGPMLLDDGIGILSYHSAGDIPSPRCLERWIKK